VSTFFQSSEDANQESRWVLVDAKDQPLGRLASNIASHLRGKLNPKYCPHNNDGDTVVVVNAEQVRLTGNKESQKTYFRHSGYVGGIKSETAEELRERKPEELLKKAVKGMIPSNALGRKQLLRLKVYTGAEHPHSAQNPVSL